MYKYLVEMFREGKWEIETRFYIIEKNLNDIDLKPIPNKRRNAKFISKQK